MNDLTAVIGRFRPIPMLGPAMRMAAKTTMRLTLTGLFALAALLLVGAPAAVRAHAGHHHGHHHAHQYAQHDAGHAGLAEPAATVLRVAVRFAAEDEPSMAAPMASGGGRALGASRPSPKAPFALDDSHPSLDLSRLIGTDGGAMIEAPASDCPMGAGHPHGAGAGHPADCPHGGSHGDTNACCCKAHVSAPAGLNPGQFAAPIPGSSDLVAPMADSLRDGIAHAPRLRPPQTPA